MRVSMCNLAGIIPVSNSMSFSILYLLIADKDLQEVGLLGQTVFSRKPF